MWRLGGRSAFAALAALSAPGPSSCSCAGARRAVHGGAPLCGSRNLLRKLLTKKKKKFWYDSPTLGPHLVHKPSGWSPALKLPTPKVRKEDSIRKRTLDVLLFRAVRDLLSTYEVGEDLYNLNIELSKASLTPDFSACRMYWKTAGNKEQDDYVDKVLQKCAPRIRHHLISNRVIGNVPPIVFVRDKVDATVQEVERLLAIADFGPAEEENELDQNDFSEEESRETDVALDTSDPPVLSNLFGIDHEELNKQILEYKTVRKDQEVKGIGLSEQQRQQLAEIQKQRKLRRKKARKVSDDITPQKYLMDKYNEDFWDTEGESCQEREMENQLWEIEKELEEESRNTKVK